MERWFEPPARLYCCNTKKCCPERNRTAFFVGVPNSAEGAGELLFHDNLDGGDSVGVPGGDYVNAESEAIQIKCAAGL